jgi:RibD C-terminal domain
VAKLKGQSGKDIVVWGSISLAQSLVSEGLIDEYRLVVCPFVLGSGRPLFRDMGAAIELKLLHAKAQDLGAFLRRHQDGQCGTAVDASAEGWADYQRRFALRSIADSVPGHVFRYQIRLGRVGAAEEDGPGLSWWPRRCSRLFPARRRGYGT